MLVLGIGLQAPVAAEALRNAALDGSIIDLMEWFPVRAGNFFHIPPGTVHAISPGRVLWCDPGDLGQTSSDFACLVICDHAPNLRRDPKLSSSWD